MPQTINVNSTFARQNFFQILEQAANENKTFIIEKKDLQNTIMITKNTRPKKAQARVNLNAIEGMFDIKKRFVHETTLAHKLYALKQAKKLG